MRRWCPALLLIFGLLIHSPSAGAATQAVTERPFASDSIWNLPLRADVPLHQDSAQYVASLGELIRAHSAWINTTRCAQPLYWATRKTPRSRVAQINGSFTDPRLAPLWNRTPIPSSATPADCSDANMAVALRRRDGRISVWEFWRARKTGAGRGARWSARWGGYTDDIRVDSGIASGYAWRASGRKGRYVHSSAQWNVTASSISMIAGVITKEDLARGEIDHALSIATTDTARGHWLWPAQRTDGGDKREYAVPAGAHFRLDPAVDVDQLNLSPMVRMIARAAQRYGIVVRDRSFSANVLYTDGRTGVAKTVSRLLEGNTPSRALQSFPWDRLQLIDAPTCRTPGRCSVEPRAVIDTEPVSPSTSTPLRLDTSNSELNHPRSKVTWDLDGDGVYETSTGVRPSITLPAGQSKPSSVGVRIRTRDGVTTRVKRDLATSPITLILRVLRW